MDPKETTPRSAAREDTRKPNDPAQTGETYDEGRYGRRNVGGIEPQYLRWNTFREHAAWDGRGDAGTPRLPRTNSAFVGGTEAYWDNEGPGPAHHGSGYIGRRQRDELAWARTWRRDQRHHA